MQIGRCNCSRLRGQRNKNIFYLQSKFLPRIFFFFVAYGLTDRNLHIKVVERYRAVFNEHVQVHMYGGNIFKLTMACVYLKHACGIIKSSNGVLKAIVRNLTEWIERFRKFVIAKAKLLAILRYVKS